MLGLKVSVELYAQLSDLVADEETASTPSRTPSRTSRMTAGTDSSCARTTCVSYQKKMISLKMSELEYVFYLPLRLLCMTMYVEPTMMSVLLPTDIAKYRYSRGSHSLQIKGAVRPNFGEVLPLTTREGEQRPHRGPSYPGAH